MAEGEITSGKHENEGGPDRRLMKVWSGLKDVAKSGSLDFVTAKSVLSEDQSLTACTLQIFCPIL